MARAERPGVEPGAGRRAGLLTPVTGALVTGAGSGIGAATAEALADAGYGVVCADQDLDAARSTAARLAAGVAVGMDVRSPVDTTRAVDLAVERFGSLRAVAACAGIHRSGEVTTMSVVEFDQVMGVNTTGSFLTAREAARAMRLTGGGSIVLVGSMNSAVVSLPGQVAYAPSKGGVLMLAKVLAVDLAPHGIRVNIVLPGVTDTPLSRSHLADPGLRARSMQNVPMGRPAEPADVAATIEFLVSDRSRAMTGAAVAVDGGQLAKTSMFPWVH